MASTYSTSLRLTLPGDGDQSGIWGQTTNSNLGTLLEQAITGVVSIAMADANYTLTNFNGVSDEARNSVLVVGGTNSAVRDLIPPLVKKLYTVINNTGGGFAIRVIGSSGTGVNIPNGVATPVYCDGINFYSGLSGAAGNFSVNGAITATGNAVVGGALSVTGTTTLTGAATAPTASYPDNTTKIATTAYVTNAINSSATTPIPSGSVFLLYQASAPTGWTQITTAGLDDSALRIVTSTGGSTGGTTAFSTVFANQTPIISVGATTLSTAQLASHGHNLYYGNSGTFEQFESGVAFGSATSSGSEYTRGSVAGSKAGYVVDAGSSSSHTHSGTSSAVTLNVKYVNIILCSKD